ncbi:MAG: hypothetical protein J5691_06920 [Bacilli bacterium]|nr:hypothetical protein [Bacilli bacterium]
MSQKDLEKEVLEEISAEETNDEILPESDKEENQEEVLEASTRKVRVKLNVDYRTLKYYNVYVLKYVRKFYWLYAIFLLLLIGGIVYSVIVKTYVVVALMAVFALYLVYQMLSIERTIDRQLTAHFMRRRPQVQEYTFTDEGITVVPAEGGDPINYEWVYVTHIYQIPQFYYLYLGKQPIIVDRNEDMILEGTKEDLEGIIASQATKKPFKSLDKNILKEPVEFNYPDYDAMDAARAEEQASLEENKEEDKPADAAEAEVVEESAEPVEESSEEAAAEVSENKEE